MKKIEYYEIISNKALTADIYEIVLKGDTSWIDAPGKFMNIKLKASF